MSEKDYLNPKTKRYGNDEKEEEKKTRAEIVFLWLSKFFVKNFLPIVLIFAVVFGAFVPAPGVFFNHRVTIYICVSILFLYVGLYLETSKVKEALKAYKAYIWGCVSILAVTCAIGGQLTNLLTFDNLVVPNVAVANSTGMNGTQMNASIASKKYLGPFECKVGLIMYLIMPCTVGTGVIMVSYISYDNGFT